MQAILRWLTEVAEETPKSRRDIQQKGFFDRESRRAQRGADGEGDPLPIFRLGLELPPARPGEGIEFRAPIVFRFAPLRFHPPGFLHPVEGGEKRPGLYIEGALGDLLDAAGNTEAVKRLRGKGLKHQQVEGALEKVGREFIVALAHIDYL